MLSIGESFSAVPFVMEELSNNPIREMIMVMDAMRSHGINEQASEEPIFEEAMKDAKEFFDFCRLLTHRFMMDVMRVIQYSNECLIL
ncbi:hypothetical protein SLA2020_030760 [Shorea laevis]